MDTHSSQVEEMLTSAVTTAHDGLVAFEATLRGLSDADLHRADPDGGWTVAQVVSHIHLSGLLWIADLERMRHDPRLFMFREELGHDVLGAPPPSAQEAADRVASLRHALDTCLPAIDPTIANKDLEVPPFGTMKIVQWMPGLIGHLLGHVEQVREILQKRGILWQEVSQ